MLCNSTMNNGLVSLDIQQMMEDPKFSKRMSKCSDNDMCTLCMEEFSNNQDQYQIRCPTKSCKYCLCNTCMKCVFQFKYIAFYDCFICKTTYRLQDAKQILSERMKSLDDPQLQHSFSRLIENLPHEFKPETIETKKKQQQEIKSLKTITQTVTACIMSPSMDETEVQGLHNKLATVEQLTTEEPHETEAVEEVGPELSSSCIPTRNPNDSIKEEHEIERGNRNSIWLAIYDMCLSIWNQIKRFSQRVRNLLARLCKLICRFLGHCPTSIRVVLKQRLNHISHYFEHSHYE